MYRQSAYNMNGQSANMYGQPANNNMYGHSANMYGQYANMYGQFANNMYGQPANNMYGHANIYEQPANNMYGQSANMYGQPAENMYGTPFYNFEDYFRGQSYNFENHYNVHFNTHDPQNYYPPHESQRNVQPPWYRNKRSKAVKRIAYPEKNPRVPNKKAKTHKNPTNRTAMAKAVNALPQINSTTKLTAPVSNTSAVQNKKQLTKRNNNVETQQTQPELKAKKTLNNSNNQGKTQTIVVDIEEGTRQSKSISRPIQDKPSQCQSIHKQIQDKPCQSQAISGQSQALHGQNQALPSSDQAKPSHNQNIRQKQAKTQTNPYQIRDINTTSQASMQSQDVLLQTIHSQIKDKPSQSQATAIKNHAIQVKMQTIATSKQTQAINAQIQAIPNQASFSQRQTTLMQNQDNCALSLVKPMQAQATNKKILEQNESARIKKLQSLTERIVSMILLKQPIEFAKLRNYLLIVIRTRIENIQEKEKLDDIRNVLIPEVFSLYRKHYPQKSDKNTLEIASELQREYNRMQLSPSKFSYKENILDFFNKNIHPILEKELKKLCPDFTPQAPNDINSIPPIFEAYKATLEKQLEEKCKTETDQYEQLFRLVSERAPQSPDFKSAFYADLLNNLVKNAVPKLMGYYKDIIFKCLKTDIISMTGEALLTYKPTRTDLSVYISTEPGFCFKKTMLEKFLAPFHATEITKDNWKNPNTYRVSFVDTADYENILKYNKTKQEGYTFIITPVTTKEIDSDAQFKDYSNRHSNFEKAISIFKRNYLKPVVSADIQNSGALDKRKSVIEIDLDNSLTIIEPKIDVIDLTNEVCNQLIDTNAHNTRSDILKTKAEKTVQKLLTITVEKECQDAVNSNIKNKNAISEKNTTDIIKISSVEKPSTLIAKSLKTQEDITPTKKI